MRTINLKRPDKSKGAEKAMDWIEFTAKVFNKFVHTSQIPQTSLRCLRMGIELEEVEELLRALGLNPESGSLHRLHRQMNDRLEAEAKLIGTFLV